MPVYVHVCVYTRWLEHVPLCMQVYLDVQSLTSVVSGLCQSFWDSLLMKMEFTASAWMANQSLESVCH